MEGCHFHPIICIHVPLLETVCNYHKSLCNEAVVSMWFWGSEHRLHGAWRFHSFFNWIASF